MADVIAMIPVLLGSTRVPDKNIILVDGRILCSYTIEACKRARVFSDICLNSEDAIFDEVAEKEGVRFHKRPADFGGRACRQKNKSRDCAGQRCAINDHYLYQFMKHGPKADYVCQVNTTSPLLKPETIRAFVERLTTGDYDSLFATQELRAESFFADKPLTFSRKMKQPSSELAPIQAMCWAIAGWRRETFIACFERDDPNEDGPVFGGKLGVFPVDEREALDIDQWSTLEVVEQFLIARRLGRQREWKYLDGRTVIGG